MIVDINHKRIIFPLQLLFYLLTGMKICHIVCYLSPEFISLFDQLHLDYDKT